MRRNRCSIGITSGIVFCVAIFMLFFGNAIASECERCHTQKDRLKAITDNLPKKIVSAETSGQG